MAKIRPENIDEDMLTRNQRLGLQRRGSFMPAETGYDRGTFFNPARIAGQQPEGAGNVGPNYREQLAERDAAKQAALFQGTPEDPRITAMRQQAEAMQAQSRQDSEARQKDFDFRNAMGNPIEPGALGTRGGQFGTGFGGETVWSHSTEGMLLGQGGGGVSGRGARGSQLTPQQQTQNWSDVNTAANAEILPEGGQSSAKPAYNLFGRSHLDTAMISMGRDAIPKDVRTAYRTQTKEADTKLRIALSGRAGEFATIDEAKLFISSLGFDDRVGQHIDNRMVEFLSRSQPELYKQFVGEQKAEAANESSYVQWVKQNATDPEIARATSDQIMAMQTPESMRDFEQDINARHYECDAVTGKPELRPERKLTPIEEMQEQEKVLQYQASQDPDLMVRGGKLVSQKAEINKRTSEINKELDELQKSSQRNREFAFKYPELLTPNERLAQNADYVKRKTRLETELNQLTTGGQPAPGAPPFMTPEQATTAAPGTEFTDDKGNVHVVPETPATGSPTRGIGTITSADGTVLATNAPAATPAVKPVAEAAPYVAPIASRENIIQQAGTPRSEPFGGQVARRKDIVDRAIATAPPEPAKAPPTEYGDFSPEIRAQIEKMTPPDVSTKRILKDIGKSAGKKLVNATVEAYNVTGDALIEAPKVVSDAVIWYLKIPWTEAKFIAKFGAKKLDEVLEPRKQAILEEWKLNQAKELAKKGEK